MVMVNDMDNRWLDAEHARLTREAHALCNERFPRRFRAATVTHPDVAAWVTEFHDLGDVAAGLLIGGSVGAGKTWQAYAAVRAAVTRPVMSRAGHPHLHAWRTMTFAGYCAFMRPRPGTDTEGNYQRLVRLPLLMVDDLGIAKGSDFTEEITYRLVNDRSESCLPTVFTTNYSGQDIQDKLGDRIYSRLTQMCRTVAVNETDQRRQNGVQTVLESTHSPERPGSGTRGWDGPPAPVTDAHRRAALEAMRREIRDRGYGT